MPNESSNNSLLQTITTMINNIVYENNGYDTLINVLSLLCLLLILNRTQPSLATPLPQNTSPTDSTNPLQKILGDLTKNVDSSAGGPSPDMLMSLLPLLNNPQVKSKLNPANISNILGMLSSFGGGVSNEKPEKKEPPAASATTSVAEKPLPVNPVVEEDKKDLGRSLNWKNNFQNEKEV